MTAFRSFFDSFLTRSFAYSKRLRPAGPRVAVALDQAIQDSRYHDRAVPPDIVAKGIIANDHRLPVYLYRLGRSFYLEDAGHPMVGILHGLMRQTSGCEIYFSNEIGTGFRVVHGLGTVIGSRNTIGEGFTIYQGSTIGHRRIGEEGARIGSHVTVFANSSVLGPIRIGDGATIGAHALVMGDVPPRAVVFGSKAVRPTRNPRPGVRRRDP